MTRETDRASLPSSTFIKILSVLAPWGLAARLALLLAVTWWGDTFFIVFASVSVAAYGLAFLLVRKHAWEALIVLYGLEWSFLLAGLVISFGWECGFQMHVLLLVVAVLMFDHQPLKKRIVLALIPILIFPILFPIVASLSPLHPLPTGISLALNTANNVAFISCIMLIVLYFIRSVNEARREAEQQSSARGRLIADLSHELKTPLSAMLLRIQSTLKHGGDADRKDALAFCEHSSRLMAGLSSRMLDLVHLSKPGSESSMEEVDVSNLVQDCLKLLKPVADQKQVQMLFSPKAPLMLTTDPVYFLSITNNILSNAIRHSPKGASVTVTLKDEPGRVVIEVADTGEGIAETDLPHIFDPFYRADKARSRAEGSVGLGLSIAQEYSRRLGGDIRVESKSGSGATFWISLPQLP